MTTSLRQTRGAKIRTLRETRKHCIGCGYIGYPDTDRCPNCAGPLTCGLSQRALARQVGISQAHVGRAEQGTTDVSIDVLERLAAVLGVTVPDLFEVAK